MVRGGIQSTKLLQALKSTDSITDPFSEAAYLKKVLEGDMVLALTIHSADGISSALKVKSQVEHMMRDSDWAADQIQMAIIGGAESYMVAQELADASVGDTPGLLD